MRMLKVKYVLEGVAPLSFSKKCDDRPKKEDPTDYEKRIWRDRCHYSSDGFVINPPSSTLKGFQDIAKQRSDTVPGKKRQTLTKYVGAGVIQDADVVEYVLVPDGKGGWKRITRSDLESITVFVPANGKVGDGARVNRIFPIIQPPWRIEGGLLVFSQEVIVNKDLIPEYFELMGLLGGLGRFRPNSSSRGTNGRFKLIDCTMAEV